MVTMAQLAVAVTNHRERENEDIKQILQQSVANVNASINNNLVQNIYHNWGYADTSGIAELQALGLEVDNKDPLSENLANVGTMNCAAEAIYCNIYVTRTSLKSPTSPSFVQDY